MAFTGRSVPPGSAHSTPNVGHRRDAHIENASLGMETVAGVYRGSGASSLRMSQRPTTPETDPEPSGRERRDRWDAGPIKWVSAVVALVGLWVLASPFVYEATRTALWNDVVVGAAIVLLAGYNYYRVNDPTLLRSPHTWFAR